MQRRASLALILLVALTGCAGEADIYAVIQDRLYAPSDFKFAASNKTFRAVIAGNPFKTIAARTLHDDVLAAMQPTNWWQPLPFTPKTVFTDEPKGLHNERYHVVVALNPDEEKAWYRAPCAGNGIPPTQGAHDTVKVRMYFCRDTVPLSLSHGTLSALVSPNEARFKRMITRLAMELFPQRRTDNDCVGFRLAVRC